VLEVWLWLDVFLEIIEYLILSQLKPKHVDYWIGGVQLFNDPPGSSISEDTLDEWAIVAFTHIQDIIRQFLDIIYSKIVGQIDKI
jgi:hypothetical protein